MKVLIVHQHFKTPLSGGAIRSYYLARALVQSGIPVVVITTHNEKKYRIEAYEGIEVHRLPVAYDNRLDFFGRVASFLKFMWRAANLAGKLSGITHCYAISVPLTVGLTAMRIKSRLKIPFIFEVGDLWPEAPIQMGFVRNPLVKQMLYRLEKEIYQSASSIVALSPAIKAAIEKKVPGKRVVLLPNMADCDFYFPSPKDPHLETKFSVTGKFVVSYIGAIGVANGLDYLLECANLCRKKELPIRFMICGDGALLDRLKRNAYQLGLQNLNFIPFTHREGVREVMNVTDATFVCYKNVPILETGSPNKYFDGLAAGKLMVINFGGWIKNEIESANCGFYCNPQQPQEFVNKIAPYLNDCKLLQQAQSASRLLAEQRYSRRELSLKFCSFFKSTS